MFTLSCVSGSLFTSSMIFAKARADWFAYNAATRADMLPRMPTPAPDPAAKSH